MINSGMLTDSDIVIGRVLGPFGNKGEVKVKVLTDFPERFTAGNVLTLVMPDDSRRNVRLRSFREHKNVSVAHLDGCVDRLSAEALRDSDFVVDRSEVETLPEGSFYIYEIVGCSVLTDDGRDLGVVTEIVQSGANDVYITSTGLCIPALKQVVLNVDTIAKIITIHPMAGMLAD